jgi:hypothetical protein
MAKKAIYEIVYVGEGRQSLLKTTVKSINEMATALEVGERVTASWKEVNSKIPKTSFFHEYLLGYREFEKTKDGISYSRFPMHDF